MNLYNLNDLLIEVALFSNFSIKFDKLCMHCFPNQAFMSFWNNINDYLTLIYPGSEFHISGSNHERLFVAGFWIYIFNLHCFLSYSVWIFNTEKDPSQLAFTHSMSTIDSLGKNVKYVQSWQQRHRNNVVETYFTPFFRCGL